jgi:transcriptional regulator with XRE-family HTH domain
MPADPEAAYNAECGALIYRARRSASLTQRDLAPRIGYCWQQIGKYERGETPIPVPVLHRIARALGIPVWRLVPGVARLLDAQEASYAVSDLPEDVASGFAVVGALIAEGFQDAA